MRPERVFDLAFVALAIGPTAVVMALASLAVLLIDGRPVFHASERMMGPDQPFRLWKFRTMLPATADAGVTGGDKNGRITRLGHLLRRFRIDELPQLFNILRGDMSVVGPRPPLRRYVERYPDLYARVLRNRPGLTGLATLVYRRHEARLLAGCRTAAETDDVYRRRCIPTKARLDLIHQSHRSVLFDATILFRTLTSLVRP